MTVSNTTSKVTATHMNPARERHWVCAQRIRERRLALGLTQREVVARLGRRGNSTTNRGLSSMENGRGLDLGLLPELAEALHCTVTYLLGLTANPAAWDPADTKGVDATTVRQLPAPREVSIQGSGILGPDVPATWARKRQ
ncbi:transcriptional regulator with XRE-family HTH domain [Kibdelosporangium banguiense]|uniref:Transcriptional regulator with XRE-family HTH domain n=1 Tax=Kibdelosporangium banguiense TaxID=1365924 RepID=A0ABS4T856_9PSEU|nr:helix-turn-helix transcriptional regulator [Kibdelosporangium banguiense]MBP2320036.1 transcriptional regulator with XRE-family HTH domain [Kibdelosporangium banguiense]